MDHFWFQGFILIVWNIDMSTSTTDIGCLNYYNCVKRETGLSEDFSHLPTLCKHQGAARKCYDKPKIQFCYSVSQHFGYSSSHNTLVDRMSRNCTFIEEFGKYVLCLYNADTSSSRKTLSCLTKNNGLVCASYHCKSYPPVLECSEESKNFIKFGFVACIVPSGAQQNIFEKMLLLSLIAICRLLSLYK